MPYTYDYTSAAAGDENAFRRYWRAIKMTLTRRVRTKTFRFDGREYEYLYHPYNRTWKNERGVEIPIFRELLLKHEGKRVLEVGNVLSHYFPIHHEVIDKYEVSSGVINQDIVEFVPQDKYDLIISISTLEHVGWDEQPQKPGKLLQAIDHLRATCLAPSGRRASRSVITATSIICKTTAKVRLRPNISSNGSQSRIIGWSLIGMGARTRPTADSSPMPSASEPFRDSQAPSMSRLTCFTLEDFR